MSTRPPKTVLPKGSVWREGEESNFQSPAKCNETFFRFIYLRTIIIVNNLKELALNVATKINVDFPDNSILNWSLLMI